MRLLIERFIEDLEADASRSFRALSGSNPIDYIAHFLQKKP